jgi:hypothetical protein
MYEVLKGFELYQVWFSFRELDGFSSIWIRPIMIFVVMAQFVFALIKLVHFDLASFREEEEESLSIIQSPSVLLSTCDDKHSLQKTFLVSSKLNSFLNGRL